jgi:hypothetical protein
MALSVGLDLVLCNWVFDVSDWQKVQLNTDLLKQGTKYSYTNAKLD